ncbi:phosphotransferase system enzyme I (PtsI) [Paenibacillus phyllosphaerae]|uniref:Phosphoenolpyruvate-protein phosphotransferase n=1 Tax=Paenibacillus phyllosphaerae TaxID=274593 RepID=A0A7W5FLB1_9BACL|nr:phosphoenolpyruvate--protein phosphotransferase [Paenibacillus phyllosphaerae]MBB3108986.1 phosphotransferase system enzyme I (PtsI) [Paenibacillus phyllosphaerae]
MSRQLKGIAASPGYAIAKVITLKGARPAPTRVSVTNAAEEQERFRQAVERSKVELEAIRAMTEQRLGADKAEIFEGHLMLLEDPELIDAAIEKIADEFINAEYALHEVAGTFIEVLESMDNELLRGRAADIRDIAGRVTSHLLGEPHQDLSQIHDTCIIIAEDLAPSDTAQLNLDAVQGFVTAIGSRTSHSAIMARSLDVSAIVGVGAEVLNIPSGTNVIMDAIEGLIIIDPTSEQLQAYESKKQQYESRKTELAKLKEMPTIASDGARVELAANIGQTVDVVKAIENGAEGIGLFRTEFLYMGRDSFPSEAEQTESYKYVLESMKGKPVVIRTMDIGGDKELPYLELPKESNPFLGLRALRFCLTREDLFRTQLRALLRASRYGNLKIMFPMIAVLSELREAKRLLEEERSKLVAEGVEIAENIEVGMMIEVPAAAIAADLFAKEVDFFSIGTNDLIQYTMAADRMNDTVSYLYQPCHPVILRLVRMVIRAAEAEGKWVGMCGEMAGDPNAVPLLLGLGLHEFSMSAGSILATRELIGQLSQAEWAKIAEEAILMQTQEEVIQHVQEHVKGAKTVC